jgi:hypothetical protein
MRSGNIIRLTRTEPINERRKRLEEVPKWRYPSKALARCAAGFILAVSFILTAAVTTGPIGYKPAPGLELPPIRDVSMEEPLWELDPKAFIDPPTQDNPNWMRVGFEYSPGPKRSA